MINTLSLKFGRAPGLSADPITTTPVTVFVGPNNSGKSKVLQELHHYCRSGRKTTENVILDELSFIEPDPDSISERIQYITLIPSAQEALDLGNILVGNGSHRQQVPRASLIDCLLNPSANVRNFCRWYLGLKTLMLDGPSRINLVSSQPAGDLQSDPGTSLQTLLRDSTKRAHIRRIIHDALGEHLVLDPTNLGQLRLRLSKVAPISDIQECGIHEDAVRFHRDALPIEQTSDGVKAFAGILTEIIAGDPYVLLIDEPEAFLHPSLSFNLGKEIAQASSSSDKRLFVSTHSPNFVMGCIQSGVRVNIVRLTYRAGVATARLLESKEILTLMRDPLLRSTHLLNALFYEFVVVTEADADRAFYQEINERLLMYKPEWGIPNCLFLNAQNKQTVQRIIEPLRRLGIPAAGVVDIDVLKEGGRVWSRFLESGFVPDLERTSLATSRGVVYKRFEEIGREMKRCGGTLLLSEEDREAADNLFDRLEEYGLFVVRVGELETWLGKLNASGHGPSWLIDVFTKMGDDPEKEVYMTPEDGDVWQFVGQVKKWLSNPNRKGIPS